MEDRMSQKELEIQESKQELFNQLHQTGIAADLQYDVNVFTRRINLNLDRTKKAVFEIARDLFVIKKMETFKEFVRIGNQMCGLSDSQLKLYTRVFERSIQLNITPEKVGKIGFSKFQLLTSGLPDEYINEYREEGTVEGKEVAGMTRNQIKEMIKSINEKTEYDLSQEKEKNDQLFEENKHLQNKIKNLQQKLQEKNTGVIDFAHLDSFMNIINTINNLKEALTNKAIETAKEQQVAEGYMRIIDDELNRARQLISNRVFADYDPNNVAVQNIINDKRFDFSQADDTITEE
jgi:hypothetical protein